VTDIKCIFIKDDKMNTQLTVQTTKSSKMSVSHALQDVLSNTYGLYLVTHNYHWNVEGRNFSQFHALFSEQYNALFQAIDVIAERIRALGEYALPFEGESIIAISKMTSNPLNKEKNAEDRAERMLHNLIKLNDAVVLICQIAKTAAKNNLDDETENLMVERITAHQKALWMFKSSAK
jgi:starvation-inducible DNA-binding protein